MNAQTLVTLILAIPALALAGCTAPPEPVGAAGAEGTQDAELADALAFDAIAFEGNIPAHATPCAAWVVGYACLTIPPVGDWRSFTEVDAAGDGKLTVTAAWTASVATNAQMVMWASLYDGESYEPLDWVFGPSPLSWDLKVDVPEGSTLLVGLINGNSGVNGGAAWAYARANPVAQPFTLEGAFAPTVASEPSET